MKKIDAVIQPSKLEGRQQGYPEVYRGQQYVVDFLPKMKLEIVISDHRVNEILDALCAAARSGRIGGGNIFVTPVEQAVRIRSGERGDLAI